MARTDQALWEWVIPLADEMKKIYSFRAICSAGIVALARMTPLERERTIALTQHLSKKELEHLSKQFSYAKIIDEIFCAAEAVAEETKKKRSRVRKKT